MRTLAFLLVALLAAPAFAGDLRSPHTFSFYTGRISSEATWHDVLMKPYSSKYADSYLAAVAYSRAWRQHFDGALITESEVNLAYNFGAQDHWELNVAPIGLRWQRFPWSRHVHSSIAFDLGLSYAFDFPRVEYELENDTKQLLLFWALELTGGPVDGPWEVFLRLHHRSPGWGIMGVADGGMNAPSLGVRYAF
ncbi:MAG TPA: hypothetical protein VFP37_00990 [Steroidobacteraceae bacterium]|nr:hypothetical protein [Steroidobacteraceae bacterium]